MENGSANTSTPNRRLEEALQGFADLNLIIDARGQILQYKFGHFQPELSSLILGSRIQELIVEGSVDVFERALQAAQQQGYSDTFESKIILSNRERWFNVRIATLPEDSFLFVARDVTDCRETEARLKNQMQQLSVLRSIDLAIASGLDLSLLLTMLLDQVVELMKVDAAAILLQNSKTNLLEFTAGKGFRSSSLRYTHLRLGEGCAGRVALERKLLNIPNLNENEMDFGRSPLFHAESFVAYYGVPLMARGRVLGVLEMFHRSTLRPDPDWLNFLNMVAGQAAIAIDNAVMFRELQHSNVELSFAYDATIESLMRVLDLRDKETEEHTRRVSDITIRMATRLGVEPVDMIHIRRGAILHDIGKMAIPDRILFKPGPLSDDEWNIMRRHPDIAVDLLSSVAYLSPALAIPHWHHERWDGAGYPDKLHGQEIPFPARLFALVDVYDALTSNRPYRGAWSKPETLAYIESQSGRHFDPLLVPEFVHFMETHPL
jgi:putative nucleotidyltransferase with HDIG domain